MQDPTTEKPEVPAELLRRIREIEIKTRHLADDLFAGAYLSTFKGRGMDFQEVREYQMGDDVRLIDWNVTARVNKTYLKTFAEERELSVMLLLDISPSGTIGSTLRSKRELEAEVAALLAFSAFRNNDKVGLLLFSDQVEFHLRPRKGRNHILRLIREILHRQPEGRGTSCASALRYLDHVLPRRAIVFLISDFLDADYQSALKVTKNRHDVIAIHVDDALEQNLPNVGWVTFEDAETGEIVEVNTGNAKLRALYAEKAAERRQQRIQEMRRMGVDVIPISTGENYEGRIRQFFDNRLARGR